MPGAANEYDELPYADVAYFHTHPSNLAVVASLCGLTPPAMERCRVLELGCGAGFNLTAMAHSLPDSHFVGIDSSARQIEAGRARLSSLGVRSVELHCGNVAEIDLSLGQFDFIIAHGLFSWVSPAEQKAILAACRRHLAPNGIAYISYNTHPGWHVRNILRDMLRFNDPSEGPLLGRVRAARAGLEQMLAILPCPELLFGQFMTHEIASIRDDPDYYILHEFLGADNHPMLFEKFVGLALEQGLRFVAEARLGTNAFVQDSGLQRAFDALSMDPIHREQYHDFLRNRTFRQSLLCRGELQPTYTPDQANIEGLYVLRNEEPHELETTDPLLKSFLGMLSETWPRPIAIKDVTARLRQPIADYLWKGYARGFWQLYAYEPPYSVAPGEFPKACPLARRVAEQSDEVTNRLHRPVKLTDAERTLLRRFDGRTSRNDNPELLKRFVETALLEG